MAKRRKRPQARKIYPLPEGLLPGTWTVKSSELPSVNVADRIMEVPLEDSEIAAYGRAHEMVHVKITPAEHVSSLCTKHGISQLAMQACEDMRVHNFMINYGIPMPLFTSAKELRDRLAFAAKESKLLTSLLLATRFSPQHQVLSDEIVHNRNINHDMVFGAYEALRLAYDDLSLRYYGRKGCNTREGFELITVPVARMFDALFSNDGHGAIDLPNYAALHGHGDGHVAWGKLEGPQKIRLTIPRKSRKGFQRTWRDEGVIPTAVHRLPVDGRVFARRRKDRGGTVLIDASGSMAFSSQDLADVISTAPGATIGVYAGDGKMGRLLIVAANGRMADRDVIDQALSIGEDGRERGSPMCGNVVDGPALRWLARQPGPRVWYSDGVVTGERDRVGLNLAIEVNQIAREADIERVSNWREALEALQ